MHADGAEFFGIAVGGSSRRRRRVRGASGRDPDTGFAGLTSSGDAKIRARTNHRFFQHAYVPSDIAPDSGKLQDRIANDLAGTVVGDVAAAVGEVKFNIFLLQEAVRSQQVLTFSVAAHGDDVRVFAKQERVLDDAGLARRDYTLLQRERFSIADEAKIDDEAGAVVRE